MSELPKRLYIGAQNDILYLVDEPPSPAGNDYPLATAGSDPIAKFFASDRRTQQLAQALVDAYNAEIGAADERGQARRLAAGWLDPDKAERLKREIAELRVVLGTIREGDDYDPSAMVMLYDQAVDEVTHLKAANERMGWAARIAEGNTDATTVTKINETQP